jgi:hypothetical protein
MVQRSRPHGREASRVIAMWKDPERGEREIALEPGAQGVVLTACAERATRGSADGRSPVDNVVNLYDVAVYQVRVPPAVSAPDSKPRDPRPEAAAPLGLESDEVSIVTGWAQSMAEALTEAPACAKAVVDDARAGAPWRPMLGLAEPPSRVVEAMDSLGRVLRAATPPGGLPTFESVLGAVDEHLRDPGVDGLVRRVVRSTLEQARCRRG